MARGRSVVRPVAAIAAIVALALAAPGAAPAGTNNSTTLEVLAGETLTLSGVNSYTGSITIRAAGTLLVGSPNSLELRAPVITVESGGVIACSHGGTGGTLKLRGDTISLLGTVSASGGTDLNGGTVDIRADRTLTVSGAGANIGASGGPGWNNPAPPGEGRPGGHGGAISLSAPVMTFSSPGGVTVAGGQGGDDLGTGGNAGSVTLRAGTLTRSGSIDAGGGNGGRIHGIEWSRGGNGGTIAIDAARDKGSFSVLDVSGGLGYYDYGPPPGGAPGTLTTRIAAWAPFAGAPTLDGTVNPESDYPRSWRWTYPTSNDDVSAYLHTDGVNLYIGMKGPSASSNSNTTWWVFLDTKGDGGTAPKSDDLQLYCVPSTGVMSEYVGNGTEWTPRTPSGWIVYPASSDPHVEYSIELAKLGILPGQAQNMRAALRRLCLSPYGFNDWPDTATDQNPSTWAPLSSSDAWTLPGNTPPGGWSDFAPTTTSTRSPICTIRVTDAIGGLDVSRAFYRYTGNAGTTWSEWLPATCTGSDGTTEPQTITSGAFSFPGDSFWSNRIQFRVFDMHGMAGTSDAIIVNVDATPPGGWTGFAPAAVVTDTVSPDCSVTVVDSLSGLDTTSAEYQYSRDGGDTWSAWLPATCTGSPGNQFPQSMTAVSVPFDQSSAQNRVRFRIRDMAGGLGTSTVYSVSTSATIAGLPRNGDVELGRVDRVPSLWRASYLLTSYGSPWNPGFMEHEAYVRNTETARFDGRRATKGKVFIEPGSSPRAYEAETIMAMATADDFTGVNEIELAMRDIVARCDQGSGTFFNPHAYIVADIGDGTTTSTVTLYSWDFTAGTVDHRVRTETGADGAAWGIYRIPLGSLSRSSVTMRLRWHVDGTLDPVGASLTCSSLVDGIRALDGSPPSSQASNPSTYWARSAPSPIGFTATDNMALASITLQGQADTGVGWSGWADWATQSIAGRSATGSFPLPGPAADGRYALRTIAVDAAGNTEAPPLLPDAQFGVDSVGPLGWTGFSPTGWVTTRSPLCSVDVYDLWSGLGLRPVLWAAGDRPVESPAAMWSGESWVLAGEGPVLSTVRVDDLSGSTLGSADLGRPILDILSDRAGAWAFCGLDAGGIVPVGLSDPGNPDPGPPNALGTIPCLALYEDDRSTVLYAGRADEPTFMVVDAGDPARGLPETGEVDLLAPPTHMAITDSGILLVATKVPDIEVFDLTEPTVPKLVGILPLTGGGACGGLDAAGDLAVAGDASGQVRVIDARVPSAVAYRGSTDIFRAVVDLVADGDRAYIQTEDDGARVVSITDPDAPSLLWELDRAFTGTKGGVLATGRYCLVTENADTGRHVWVLPEPACSWSSDGGTTWSEWYTAGSPSEGTTATFTMQYRPRFEEDSGSDNKVRWRVGDVVGNLAPSPPTYTVLVDTTDPGAPGISSITHPDPDAWYAIDDVRMDWTAPSDISGIAGYSILWADSGIVDPDFTIDTSALTTTALDVPDGQHWFNVRARDNAGNWGASTRRRYQIDTRAPSEPTNLKAAPASWAATATFALKWDNPIEVDAPIAAKRYKIDSAPTSPTDGTRVAGGSGAATVTVPASDGTHTVYVWVEDAAGNTDHTKRASVQVYVDRTAPTAPTALAAAPSSWAATTAFTVTWTNPAQTASPIAAKRYKWGAVPTSATDGTRDTDVDGSSVLKAPSTDGTHTLYVWLEDGAGNISHTNRAAVSVYVDRTAPAAPTVSSSTHPVTTTWYSGATVTMSWTPPADISGVTGYSWAWTTSDASVPDEIVDTAGTTASQAVPADGVHYFHVRAKDNAGNWGPAAHRAYRVDRTAPTAPTALAASPSGWASTTAFTVTWTNPAQSASPIVAKRYKWDAVPTSATDGTRDTDVDGSSVLTAPSADGTHTLYVWLEDAAGNIDHKERASVQVYVDRTAPTAPTGLTLDPSSWSTATSGTAAWTAPPGQHAPIVAARWKTGAPPSSDASGTRVPGGTSLQFTRPSTPGTHAIYVWLEDAVGNSNCGNRATGVIHVPSPRQTVYRFYNMRTGTHFYTGSTVERDNVLATLSHVYRLEGPAYAGLAGASGGVPLYRFYNHRAGVHFYTASEVERANVQATLSHVYNFEGIAYWVAPGPENANLVYRFYNRRAGVHFYTASEVERDNVIATLSHVYNFEGPSFYVPR